MNSDCLFCEIVNGNLKVDILKETEYSVAFKDINPQAPCHILIIPKLHIASTLEINDNNIFYLSEMALLAKEIAKKNKNIKGGYRWIINTGIDGGQTVDHLHLHLIGGRKMLWPPG